MLFRLIARRPTLPFSVEVKQGWCSAKHARHHQGFSSTALQSLCAIAIDANAALQSVNPLPCSITCTGLMSTAQSLPLRP